MRPWPARLRRGWTGSFSNDSLEVKLVEPFVVEVLAGLAVDDHRWRHPVRFLRRRRDLATDDLPVLPEPPHHRQNARAH